MNINFNIKYKTFFNKNFAKKIKNNLLLMMLNNKAK